MLWYNFWFTMPSIPTPQPSSPDETFITDIYVHDPWYNIHGGNKCGSQCVRSIERGWNYIHVLLGGARSREGVELYSCIVGWSQVIFSTIPVRLNWEQYRVWKHHALFFTVKVLISQARPTSAREGINWTLYTSRVLPHHWCCPITVQYLVTWQIILPFE